MQIAVEYFNNPFAKSSLKWSGNSFSDFLSFYKVTPLDVDVFINGSFTPKYTDASFEAGVDIVVYPRLQGSGVSNTFKSIGNAVSSAARFVYSTAASMSAWEWMITAATGGFYLGLKTLASLCGTVLGSSSSKSSDSMGSLTTDPTISGSSNSLSPGSPWPVIIGKRFLTPYLCAPYNTRIYNTEYNYDTDTFTISSTNYGKLQYMFQELAVGYAPLKIHDIKIGGMSLGISTGTGSDINKTFTLTQDDVSWLTSDDELQISIQQTGDDHPTSAQVLTTAVSEESLNYEILWPYTITESEYLESLSVRLSAAGVKAVGASIQQSGMGMYREEDEVYKWSSLTAITYKLIWREVGETTWHDFTKVVDSTYNAGPYVTISGKDIEYAHRFELYGEYNPTYKWDTDTLAYTTEAVTDSYLKAHQIEFSVRRSRTNYVNDMSPSYAVEEGATYYDTCTWLNAKTYCITAPLLDTAKYRLCRIAIRATASDVLKDSFDQITVTAESMLPSYDNDTDAWVGFPNVNSAGTIIGKPTVDLYTDWIATSNPADEILACFMGIWCAKSSSINLYQNQIDDAKFLWDEFKDLWRWCNESRTVSITDDDGDTSSYTLTHQCASNIVLSSQITLRELISKIATPARASIVVVGGRFRVIHDVCYRQPSTGATLYSDDTSYKNPTHLIDKKGIICARNSSNISCAKTFVRVPDAVSVTFPDEEDSNQQATVDIRNPNLSTSEITAKKAAGTYYTTSFTTDAITNAYMIALYARYLFYTTVYRDIVQSCTVGIQHINIPLGSRVECQNDVILVGIASGRILSHSRSTSADSWTIVTDENIRFDATKTLAITICGFASGAEYTMTYTATPTASSEDPSEEGMYLCTGFLLVDSSDLLDDVFTNAYFAIGYSGKSTAPYILIGKSVDSTNKCTMQLTKWEEPCLVVDTSSISSYISRKTVISKATASDTSLATSVAATSAVVSSLIDSVTNISNTLVSVTGTIRLSADTSIVVLKGSAVYSPSTVTLSSKLYNYDGTVAAYAGRFQIYNGASLVYTSSSDESSYIYTVPSGSSDITVKLYKAGGTVYQEDERTIVIISENSGLTYFIEDGSQGYQATTAGYVSESSVSVKVRAFSGVDEIPVKIGTLPSVDGFELSKNEQYLIVTALSGTTMSAGGSIAIPITLEAITGGTVIGDTADSSVIGDTTDSTVIGDYEYTPLASATVYFKYWKVFAGESGYSYSIVTDASTFTRDRAGTVTPSTITANAFFTQADSTYATYAGRFAIQTIDADNSSFVTRYTSASDESEVTYTIPSGTETLRIILYGAGGTTVQLTYSDFTIAYSESVSPTYLGTVTVMPSDVIDGDYVLWLGTTETYTYSRIYRYSLSTASWILVTYTEDGAAAMYTAALYDVLSNNTTSTGYFDAVFCNAFFASSASITALQTKTITLTASGVIKSANYNVNTTGIYLGYNGNTDFNGTTHIGGTLTVDGTGTFGSGCSFKGTLESTSFVSGSPASGGTGYQFKPGGTSEVHGLVLWGNGLHDCGYYGRQSQKGILGYTSGRRCRVYSGTASKSVLLSGILTFFSDYHATEFALGISGLVVSGTFWHYDSDTSAWTSIGNFYRMDVWAAYIDFYVDTYDSDPTIHEITDSSSEFDIGTLSCNAITFILGG